MGQWLNPMTQNEYGKLQSEAEDKQWPVPNDTRTGIGVWFQNAGPDIQPMYVRYVTRIFTKEQFGDVLEAYLEMESQGEGHISDSVPTNADGRTLRCDARNWESDHPVHGRPGVSWTWVYHRDGFADDITFEGFLHTNSAFAPLIPWWFAWFFSGLSPDFFVWVHDWTAEKDTDIEWPGNTIYNLAHWTAISWGRPIPENPSLSPYPAPA